MRCSICGGVWHPATGHYQSPTWRMCGPCCRDWIAWLRKHTARRWGKRAFYDVASERPPAGVVSYRRWKPLS